MSKYQYETYQAPFKIQHPSKNIDSCWLFHFWLWF